MPIEHPRFPTPEDELRASALYQALRELAEIGSRMPATAAAGTPKAVDAG